MKKTHLFLAFIICFCFVNPIKAQSKLSEDILSTWDKHADMNRLLMTAVQNEYLTDTTSSGGRNIADQFAHMHNVRIMWLSQLVPKMKLDGLDLEVDAEESLKPEYLKSQLSKSTAFIRKVISDGLQNDTTDWPMSPIRFMGYLISHESHTRGQVLLALKQSGHPAPPRVAFGIWQW